MRRSNPYSFTMNFTMAGKVFLGTPLRMKGVQIGRVSPIWFTWLSSLLFLRLGVSLNLCDYNTSFQHHGCPLHHNHVLPFFAYEKQVTEVSVEPTRVAVKAEVFDARNVVPRGSRFDINQLGLVPEAFLDITTPGDEQ